LTVKCSVQDQKEYPIPVKKDVEKTIGEAFPSQHKYTVPNSAKLVHPGASITFGILVLPTSTPGDKGNYVCFSAALDVPDHVMALFCE
jgi:hypothetical protein